VDIYEEKSKEILFYSDGVCVGEQKQKRDKIAKEGKERTNINLMMLQIPSKTERATFSGRRHGRSKISEICAS
jgi:hypothetical protein